MRKFCHDPSSQCPSFPRAAIRNREIASMKIPVRSFLSLCLIGFSSAAFAAPGLTISDVHMRAGRGVNSPVVTTVPGGSNVEVFDCQGAWCAASWGRYHGFISQAYLDVSRRPAPVYGYAPPPPVVYGPPIIYGPGPYYGPYGYGYGYGYYGWRHRYRHW